MLKETGKAVIMTVFLIMMTQSVYGVPAGGLYENMIYIPAGKSQMGTSRRDAKNLASEYGTAVNWFSIETPRRTINIPAFYIDKYEVTNVEYKKFIDETGHRYPYNWGSNRIPRGMEKHPVTTISHDDALAYAKWAGKRLPTEKEWEKAASGTTGTKYPWGNNWVDGVCNMNFYGDIQQLHPSTAKVGSYPGDRSEYGVMDMGGNVSEWVADDMPSIWGTVVVKGGSWMQIMPYGFRCAYRGNSQPRFNNPDFIGFRCAADAGEEVPEYGKTGEKPLPIKTEPADKLARSLIPPKEELYMKEKIQMNTISNPLPGHGCTSVGLKVPFFPRDSFMITIPEWIWRSNGNHIFPGNNVTWKINEDKTSASYTCSKEGLVEIKGKITGYYDYVDYSIELRNLEDNTWDNVSTFSCFTARSAPSFRDHELWRTYVYKKKKGFVPVIKIKRGQYTRPMMHYYFMKGFQSLKKQNPDSWSPVPLDESVILTRSWNKEWIMAHATDEAMSLFNNGEYSCIHCDPYFGDIRPGETKTKTGRLYFTKSNLEDFYVRYKKDLEDWPDK